MSILERITVDSMVMSGKPCVSGLRVATRYFIACVGLAVLTGMGAEPWELSPNFPFGVARDGHLPEVLERIRRGNNLPALAAVSMTSTGLVELAATGLRAVGFPDRVTANDQWHLGSITKSMTATVAARLVEKGRITWDTTIGQAVPELAGAMRKEYRKVTLAQLLRHESGLPRDVPMHAQYACLTLAPDVDFAVFAACNASGESEDRACDQAAWALIQRYPPTKTPRD